MQVTKEQAVAHHETAATSFEHAAEAHREAARHAASGNFEKATRFSSAAVDHSEHGTREATEASLIYDTLSQQKAAADQEHADEAAASAAKHAAKKAAQEAE